jgi:hypothetical protein
MQNATARLFQECLSGMTTHSTMAGQVAVKHVWLC